MAPSNRGDGLSHFEKMAKQVADGIPIAEKATTAPGEISNRQEAEIQIAVALEKQRQMGRVDVESRFGNRWGRDGFLKRGIYTSEFVALGYGLVVITALPSSIPLVKIFYAVCALANCFVVSRMFAKQNRGVDRPGILCVEFWVSMLSSGFFFLIGPKHGVDQTFFLVAINAGVYIISRGMVKKLRTQTQIIHR